MLPPTLKCLAFVEMLIFEIEKNVLSESIKSKLHPGCIHKGNTTNLPSSLQTTAGQESRLTIVWCSRLKSSFLSVFPEGKARGKSRVKGLWAQLVSLPVDILSSLFLPAHVCVYWWGCQAKCVHSAATIIYFFNCRFDSKCIGLKK